MGTFQIIALLCDCGWWSHCPRLTSLVGGTPAKDNVKSTH
jgi:hypothetical protein